MSTLTNKQKYRVEYLPIDLINVLPQPRKTFELIMITELAESIADKGLLMPLIVARFGRNECANYLQAIQNQYDTETSIQNLKSADRNGLEYLVLIDGECRYRALKLLQEKGCEFCCGEGFNDGCLNRHFLNAEVPMSLIDNPLAEEALALQYSANKHVVPAPEEEAVSLHKFYKLLTKEGGKLSNRAFAKIVDRSEQTVRNALRFARLENEEIHKAVLKKIIPYGIGVELAKFFEITGDLKKLDYYFTTAISHRNTVDDFKRRINGALLEYNKQQQNFDFGLEIDPGPVCRKKVRTEVLQSLNFINSYIVKIRSMIDQGVFESDISALSDKDIVQIIKKMYESGKNISQELEYVAKEMQKNNLTDVPDTIIDQINEILRRSR